MEHNEQINIVITGHVDHGKSTVIGRLLTDTNSLPQGKLESVKAYCEKNSKTFEYAFLLDALKEEQSQGITIDAARIFFKTKKRNYLIIDAPGHIEFLKNMISGAASAEGGIIVIDIKEGIKENSKRHGYIISMLGIKQVTVLINKMDAVDYNEDLFNSVAAEYNLFLEKIGVKPLQIIPVAARNGENISFLSGNMKWYKGPTLLEQIDNYQPEREKVNSAFRFPVQDVYKFTRGDDDRRILAGMVTSGKITTGDNVVFYPSNKKSRIASIEYFNDKVNDSAEAGYSCGFILEDALYIRPGEIMLKDNDTSLPGISRRFSANLLWLGNFPIVKDKQYTAKLGAAKFLVKIVSIRSVMDSAELTVSEIRDKVERYEIAECVFEANKPVAFDIAPLFETTARFIIIDQYEISGAGIVLAPETDSSLTIHDEIAAREKNWDRGFVTSEDRSGLFRHKSKFVLLTGKGADVIGKILERKLFIEGYHSYYLGINSIVAGLDRDLEDTIEDRDEAFRRLGELAKIITDSGLIFISAVEDLDDYDIERLKFLNQPGEIIVVNIKNESVDSYPADLQMQPGSDFVPEDVSENIINLLKQKEIIPEYYL
jgi:bifunctional enzyme CysN/CysC